MKTKGLILLILIFFYCCSDEEFAPETAFSPEINFEVSEWILKEKDISCVDFDKEGTAWIGSGTELIRYKNRNHQWFTVGSGIKDISVASDGTVWIGTQDKGLAKFNGKDFSYFNMENSDLPRDYIIDVECSPDGSVWFGSSAHQLGGLMHYDGEFKLFTPENSILNQNLILGLKINSDGELFCFSEGTVTECKVFRRDKRKSWQMLDEEMMFYWIATMDITSKSEVVVATDHSLSSCAGCYTNEVAIYRDKQWEVLNRDFDMNFFNRMFVDKRDYIWSQGSKQGDYQSYFVYDGKEWHRSAKEQIPDVFIKSIKVDENNDIWFCTNEGIFILPQ